jgi:membrane protease YdiL (CAAX protease family)
MNQPFNFSDLNITIVLFGTLIFFYLYYYSAHSEFLKSKFKKVNSKAYEINLFLSKKILGFLFLGVFPGILYFSFLDPVFSFYELFNAPFLSSLKIILILVIIIILIVFVSQKSNPQRNSLQMKITDWNFQLFGIDAFGWGIYLLAYEFLFRGILLFASYHSFGFWPAIAVNVVIYSAIHMINSKEEAIGAIIFGSIAAYFALSQGTILIPVFMHIALSLSSDYFSIRLNKNLKFVKLKSDKTSSL